MMQVGDLLVLGMVFLVVTWLFYAPNNDLLAFEEFLALRIKIEESIYLKIDNARS